MSQPFTHIELRSPDLKKAENFYKTLFGWDLKPMPEMHYTLFTAGNGPGGGMMQAEPDGTPHWVPYVEVANIEEALEKAKTMGAKVRMGITPIPGAGKVAVLGDPAGSPIGLFQK